MSCGQRNRKYHSASVCSIIDNTQNCSGIDIGIVGADSVGTGLALNIKIVANPADHEPIDSPSNQSDFGIAVVTVLVKNIIIGFIIDSDFVVFSQRNKSYSHTHWRGPTGQPVVVTEIHQLVKVAMRIITVTLVGKQSGMLINYAILKLNSL